VVVACEGVEGLEDVVEQNETAWNVSLLRDDFEHVQATSDVQTPLLHWSQALDDAVPEARVQEHLRLRSFVLISRRDE
jgi:hypothetical protein